MSVYRSKVLELRSLKVRWKAFLSLFTFTLSAMLGIMYSIKKILHDFSLHIIVIIKVVADTDMDLNCHISPQEN